MNIIYCKVINEDGEACANVSNTGGMGAVVSAQPSTNAGSTIGSNFTNGGGIIGSGDIGNLLLKKPYQKKPSNHASRGRKKIKKFTNIFSKKQNWTKGQDKNSSKLMKWNNFIKK